ncbi:5L0M-A Chain A, Hlrh-1 Dna Binding Domain - 12bp Oct4 Promoter Complex [Aphelenchoides besseyi]|nr:5L0M-A Chain A, Hlrh-1 Dna Binding Domain - 12bp Oct4 Promoter Complex [Aphelenchoides besseyi]KAI6219419.1 5L0M-A Chain A, Hlrh-1 Dna Binding Domain - 12bp Oct4 Promoter Complex [Aphelenchoides besseyi]
MSTIAKVISRERLCPICSSKADHAHFGGVVSCNGCAAFFRRTVVEQKSYTCKRNLNCVVKKERHKRGCQFCRFQKCLKNGMTVDSVLAKASTSVKYDEFGDDALVFLLKCRRSTFIIRGQATVDVYGGPEMYCNMTDKQKTAKSCALAVRAEEHVLYEFLRMVGICDDNEHDFANALVDNFLQLWISCQSVYNTARYRGFQKKRMYCFDESYLDCNEDSVDDYFRQYTELMNCNLLGRLCFKLFLKIAEVGQCMATYRISDTEFTAIQFIFLLQTAIRLHPKPQRYKERLNSLFLALRKYYEDNYEDVAQRLGNLILGMQHLQDLLAIEEEVVILRRLNAVPQ